MIASKCFPSALLFSPRESTYFIITNHNNAKGLKPSNLGRKTHKWYTKFCTRGICIPESKPSHVTGFYDFCHNIFWLCHFSFRMGHVYYYSATTFFFYLTFDSDISFQRPILKYTGIFFFPSITRWLAFCFKQLQWEIFGNYTTNWLKNMLTKERHKRQS
jgi:hypothetical protein